jgi:hypothetical protein
LGRRVGLRKLAREGLEVFWGDWRGLLGGWWLVERSRRAGRAERVWGVEVASVCGGGGGMSTSGEGGRTGGEVLSLFGVRNCLGVFVSVCGFLKSGFAIGVAAIHSHRPSSHL